MISQIGDKEIILTIDLLSQILNIPNQSVKFYGNELYTDIELDRWIQKEFPNITLKDEFKILYISNPNKHVYPNC